MINSLNFCFFSDFKQNYPKTPIFVLYPKIDKTPKKLLIEINLFEMTEQECGKY